MKKKTAKPTRTSKKQTKVEPPRYIEVNGVSYERLESNSEDVEIELEEDVLQKLDALVSSGKYVSRGDAVRDILRQMIREKVEK